MLPTEPNVARRLAMSFSNVFFRVVKVSDVLGISGGFAASRKLRRSSDNFLSSVAESTPISMSVFSAICRRASRRSRTSSFCSLLRVPDSATTANRDAVRASDSDIISRLSASKSGFATRTSCNSAKQDQRYPTPRESGLQEFISEIENNMHIEELELDHGHASKTITDFSALQSPGVLSKPRRRTPAARERVRKSC